MTGLLFLLTLMADRAAASAPAVRVLDPTTIAWLRPAAPIDWLDYYPRHAWENGVQGDAEVACTVTAQGGLADCSVLSETPAGAGFGEASIRAPANFRMQRRTTDGQPVAGATVRIPMRWRLPGK